MVLLGQVRSGKSIGVNAAYFVEGLFNIVVFCGLEGVCLLTWLLLLDELSQGCQGARVESDSPVAVAD